MTFRKIIFWIHLGCGVTAGTVVLMMSITGVLLTYERQMLAWADRGYYSEPVPGTERKSLDSIFASARSHAPDVYPFPITVYADPEAPVSAAVGSGRVLYINPYTGDILGEGAKGIREFFGLMLQWHRWFNVSGDGRAAAKAITGASNLMFLFLVLSGMYLWLPKTWKWVMFKTRLLFNQGNNTSKARDYNWHHVFGIWSSVPLAIVVATATVFSYPWASDLVYKVFGEQPPARAVPAPVIAVAAAQHSPVTAMQSMQKSEYGTQSNEAGMDIEDLFSRAAQHIDGWKMITVRLSKVPSDPVVFTIDRGNGGQPQKQATLSLEPRTGSLVRFEPFAELSPGRQARALIRRLHTGEALGMIGQTIAGLVSFGGVMLVWTGLSLAYRRLIQPLFVAGR